MEKRGLERESNWRPEEEMRQLHHRESPRYVYSYVYLPRTMEAYQGRYECIQGMLWLLHCASSVTFALLHASMCTAFIHREETRRDLQTTSVGLFFVPEKMPLVGANLSRYTGRPGREGYRKGNGS